MIRSFFCRVLAALVLAGCNTVGGVARDVEAAAEARSRSTADVQSDIYVQPEGM